MTVGELAERMTADEFGEWQAMYRRQPWGDDLMMLGFGIVASTQANCHRASNARAFTPADFIPGREAPAEEAGSADFFGAIGGGGGG